MIEALEVQAARNSDHVFAITEAMRTLLVRAGISEERVTLLPNAVDPEMFEPMPRVSELESLLNLAGKTVVGFLGSMADYEGLDDLLSAIALLYESVGDRLRVLLVGDGAAKEGLERRARSLGLADIVAFQQKWSAFCCAFRALATPSASVAGIASAPIPSASWGQIKASFE